MNDINSLPTVPHHTIEAMKREAEKKFGKVIEQEIPAQQLNPILQHHEEPQIVQDIPMESDGEGISCTSSLEEIPQPAQAQETEQARNFRAIKDKAKAAEEKAKQAERERDEALRLIRELSSQTKTSTPMQPEEPDFDAFSVNPDDLIEGKHLNKVGRELNSIKQELKNYKQQAYVENSKSRLRTQFPDFDSVVNKDTIETFQYAYPELADTLNATTDVYTAGVSAYHMIKKFGVYTDPQSTPEKEMTQKNMAKPRPLTSVSPQQGDSPMSRANAFANGLTKELKEQLAKEMQSARRGY